MQKATKQRGLTLIQLVILLGFFSLCAYLLTQVFNPVVFLAKQRDSIRQKDLLSIQQALQRYYTNYGHYPISSASDTTIYGKDYSYRMIDENGNIIDWNQLWKYYLEPTPHDPSSDQRYVYYSETGQAYYLYASVEVPEAMRVCNQGKACVSIMDNLIDPLACGKVCNYAVSSPGIVP